MTKKEGKYFLKQARVLVRSQTSLSNGQVSYQVWQEALRPSVI